LINVENFPYCFNKIKVLWFVLVNNKEKNVPTPFHFVKSNVKQTYIENETNRLMGRLTTLNGKILLKFLPSVNAFLFFNINFEFIDLL